MGRKLNYKVETKVQRLPKDLQKLFTEISTAYGNANDKEVFKTKLNQWVASNQ